MRLSDALIHGAHPRSLYTYFSNRICSQVADAVSVADRSSSTESVVDLDGLLSVALLVELQAASVSPCRLVAIFTVL